MTGDTTGRSGPPSIAVILPAYNEAARIDQTIATIAAYRAGAGHRVRSVTVADDGSSDDTIAVARAAAARVGTAVEVLAYPHRGKALTVRSAMLEMASRSDADYLMMLDADDELRIDQLDRVVWSADPAAVYIGRRHDRRGAPTPTPVRRLMSDVMRVASRLLLGLRFRDTQCGFKLFPRHIVPALFGQQRATGWTFDAEILYIASRVSRLAIVEVPVDWSPRGVSRVQAIPAALSGLALFATAWHGVRGAYRPVGAATPDGAQPAVGDS